MAPQTAAPIHSGIAIPVFSLIYSADPQAAGENYRTLCDAARTDLADNNAYWAKWEGPVKEAGSTVYTGFLRGYDQTLGMKSYGACVDLLVEYYYPMAQGE